jgi:CheY-like chemotaxis protein
MRTLLVEDDDDIRTLVRLSLEQFGGWEVVETASGAAALKAAGAGFFDVVLLDVMMPGMDGPETLQQLRAVPHGSDLPVVFLTAKAMPSEVGRLLGLGAAGVITKPFEPAELVGQITSMLSGTSEGTTVAEAPAETSDEDAEIDADALRKLIGLTGDDGSELLDELIDLFAETAPASIGALRAACIRGDDATATRVAHTFKGAAGTLGAVRLAALASDVEAAAAAGGAAAAADKAQRMGDAVDDAIVQMRRVRAEIGQQ